MRSDRGLSVLLRPLRSVSPFPQVRAISPVGCDLLRSLAGSPAGLPLTRQFPPQVPIGASQGSRAARPAGKRLTSPYTAPKANITTFGDSLRWAVSTTTTVGYGGHYPGIAAGRAIGIVLMIAGAGIFGVVAASAAAWFIWEDDQQHGHQQVATVTALTAEVAALRQTVSELSERLTARFRRPTAVPVGWVWQ
jgi:hypothetical protein